MSPLFFTSHVQVLPSLVAAAPVGNTGLTQHSRNKEEGPPKKAACHFWQFSVTCEQRAWVATTQCVDQNTVDRLLLVHYCR